MSVVAGARRRWWAAWESGPFQNPRMAGRCPRAAASGRCHKGRQSLRPGGGQGGGGGQEGRCRGPERPHPALEGGAEVGKPGKPHRGQDGIVLPSHAPFRRGTQGAGAGMRRGQAARRRGETRRATFDGRRGDKLAEGTRAAPRPEDAVEWNSPMVAVRRYGNCKRFRWS